MEFFNGLRHLFVCVFLYHVSAFMVMPVMTDVTMEALCPGRDDCALAIYLTGFQQAISGIGTLMITPLVGSLSDEYGRKSLLTLPMTVAVLPLVVLASSRTRSSFFVYYAFKTLAGMVCEGSILCLSLAYVADNVSEGRRAAAFGILSGVSVAAFVLGTLIARLLPTTLTFQIAAITAAVAAVYMKAFLIDSNSGSGAIQAADPLKPKPCKRIPSVDDILCLLRRSLTFSQVAMVAFFSSLADSGLHASLLYYLKAQFHFNKDQFADLLLIVGVAGAFSQLLIMPLVAPYLKEEKLLSIGLFASCVHIILYSISWSFWVPYVAATFGVMAVFIHPCMRSIVSKQVGATEQGKAQGCISSICSFATILSPLTFTPLTALFLSDNAPFHFPGFSIMCAGFATMISFMLSLMIRSPPPITSHKASNASYVLV